MGKHLVAVILSVDQVERVAEGTNVMLQSVLILVVGGPIVVH